MPESVYLKSLIKLQMKYYYNYVSFSLNKRRMTGNRISNKSKVWKYLNHWMYWKWIFSLLSSFFVSFDITMFAKTSFSFRQMQLLRLYSNSLNETIKENNGRVIVNRKPPTVHYTYKAKTYLYPPLKSCLDNRSIHLKPVSSQIFYCLL